MRDRWDDYLIYVAELQDSYEHKEYLINNERCYEEWLEEIEHA